MLYKIDTYEALYRVDDFKLSFARVVEPVLWSSATLIYDIKKKLNVFLTSPKPTLYNKVSLKLTAIVIKKYWIKNYNPQYSDEYVYFGQ